MTRRVDIWVGALISLGIYSYLVKENPVFRFCEHLYLGLSLAHLAVMGWSNVRDVGVRPLASGEYLTIVPLVLGCLLFTRFSSRTAWLSRYPLAYLVGVASAVTITGVIDAGILSQVRGAIQPLDSVNAVISLVCNVAAISVFLFIVGSDGGKGRVGGEGPIVKTVRYGALVGRFVLMISFGAVFGTTVMARLGLFIPRLRFLFGDWIHLVPPVQ